MRCTIGLLVTLVCLLAAPLVVRAAGPQPPELVCRKAAGPIVVDGKFDEATWQRTEAIPMILPISGAQPISRAAAMVTWDDKNLYVAFAAMDQDIWSTLKTRDAQTCTEDCFEIFLKPIAENYGYANFEINALGTVMDALPLNKIGGGDDNHRWRAWDCQGMQVGVTVQGTLNNPADKDTSWQMEVAIPFTELRPLSDRLPQAGDAWQVLLAHYDHSVSLPGGVEAGSIAPLSVFSFHRPEEWRVVRFAE